MLVEDPDFSGNPGCLLCSFLEIFNIFLPAPWNAKPIPLGWLIPLIAGRLPPLKVRDLRFDLGQISADFEIEHFSKVPL